MVKTEQLGKTENSLIFIETDTPLRKEELDERLALLEQACDTQSDEAVREALRQTIPTYCALDDVNPPNAQAAELFTRHPLRERRKPVQVRCIIPANSGAQQEEPETNVRQKRTLPAI
ncbi:MAG: hypothetical protein ACLR8U_14385 [Oscillospiraceae bacterium]